MIAAQLGSLCLYEHFTPLAAFRKCNDLYVILSISYEEASPGVRSGSASSIKQTAEVHKKIIIITFFFVRFCCGVMLAAFLCRVSCDYRGVRDDFYVSLNK